MLFCTQCGKELNDNSKFCSGCGAQIVVAPASCDEVVEPVAEVSVEPVAVETIEVQNEVADEAVELIAEPEVAVAVAEQPAVQPAPKQAAPVAEPEKKAKNKPTRRGVGRTILAVFLSVLLFVFSLTGVLLAGTRAALAPSNMKSTVSAGLQYADDITVDGEDIDSYLCDELGITAEMKVDKYIKKSAVIKLVQDKLAYYGEDILNNSDKAVVDDDEIELAVISDLKMIYDDELTREEIDEEAEVITDRIMDGELLDYLDAKLLREDVPGVYYAIQYALSYWAIALAFCLVLVFMILLAKTNRWNVVRTFSDLGITFAVVGVLTLVASLVVPSVLGGLIATVGEVGLGKLPSVLLRGLLNPLFLGGLITTGGAVVFIVIARIAAAIVAKRAKKQA